MKAATNADRLVSQVLTGEVWPPLADRHGYRVGPDGQPFALKRGESGRVIVGFADDDLARMRPGDQVAVRSAGQGHAPAWLPADVTLMNLDPDLPLIGAEPNRGLARPMQVRVRLVLPARVAGNGLGRPAASWDLDLQLTSQDHPRLLLGDLVAITGIDARFNMG